MSVMSWTYTEKDVILYALSIGCTWDEARFVYENDEDFAPLPTFGVLALHKEGALDSIDFAKLVPNYNPVSVLSSLQAVHFLMLIYPDFSCQHPGGLVSEKHASTIYKVVSFLDDLKAKEL